MLGDSHAMGWGVDDHQTFAARLQALAGRPVHNLAVSSYGTARELGALERSDLLDAVDTVLVQYCDNDRDENLAFVPPSREAAERSYAQVVARPAGSLRERLPFLWAGLRYALKVPFGAVKERWRGERTLDFAPHLEPLAARLRAHPALGGKRVIVFYVNAHGQRFHSRAPRSRFDGAHAAYVAPRAAIGKIRSRDRPLARA
ncbi:MAG: SGNH/GDSL hydrolase family protein [Betaproteobacteria bacterium]|nr:SGNH/GDSL hydrolase family protein [Betaproteobacteria bacterium]